MYNLLKLNLARNSLRYIIKTYDIKEIYIPYYLCNVIRQAVIKEHCKPLFYHIDDNFLPCTIFPDDAFILYPNYFGICNINVEKLSQQYKNLIIDNAHAFYSTPKGLACFNSVRKFLPVYNGSYLWIKEDKLKFNEEDYNVYPTSEQEKEQNEINFQNSDILFINEQIENEILKFDNKEERLKLFFNYHEKYKNINLLNIDTDNISSPFCYPVLFENSKTADNFVKELTVQDITIYRYWERLPKDFNEYKFYERLVCIPLKCF